MTTPRRITFTFDDRSLEPIDTLQAQGRLCMPVKNNQWWNSQLGAAVGQPRASSLAIRGLWLLYEGTEGSPDRQAVVIVELLDGTMKRAIVEPLDGAVSHYVHPEGMLHAPIHHLGET